MLDLHDLGPFVTPFLLLVTGLVSSALVARRLGKLGFASVQSRIQANLKEIAETWEERFNLERIKRLDERADFERQLSSQKTAFDQQLTKEQAEFALELSLLTTTKEDLSEKLQFAEFSGDECRRELDRLRAEMYRRLTDHMPPKRVEAIADDPI